MIKETKPEMEVLEFEEQDLRFSEGDGEEFDAELFDKHVAEFRAQYPDCPPINPIPVLDLIMKREYAEAIIRGEKKVELRAFSDFYVKRIYDQAMVDFVDRHIDDVDVSMSVDYYISEIRPVQKIHFHNYNNSWFLDVSVRVNDLVSVTSEDIKFLHEQYDCHELDELLRKVQYDKDQNPPSFFYFEIGDILDTNLTV